MSSAKAWYLIAYNGLSASAWFSLLLQILISLSEYGYTSTYTKVGIYVQWVQTLAVLEILHSVTGIYDQPCSPFGNPSNNKQVSSAHRCSQH